MHNDPKDSFSELVHGQHLPCSMSQASHALEFVPDLAHAVHQAVQHNVEVNALTTLHELGHYASNLMSAEAHVDDVINDLLQRDSVCLSLCSTLQQRTAGASTCH